MSLTGFILSIVTSGPNQKGSNNLIIINKFNCFSVAFFRLINSYVHLTNKWEMLAFIEQFRSSVYDPKTKKKPPKHPKFCGIIDLCM